LIAKIIGILSAFIVAVISTLGYSGIVLLMAIESACIPLPSEIIMPFSGYLVHTGQFNLWLVGLAGAVGCVLGSLVAYYVGMYGGRPLIEKYGRYVLVSHHDLDLADRWFSKYGEVIVFASRLLPVIRHLIGIPAGILRLDFRWYALATLAGSLLWTSVLAWLGLTVGRHPELLKGSLHRFFLLVLALAAVLGALYYVFVQRPAGRR